MSAICPLPLLALGLALAAGTVAAEPVVGPRPQSVEDVFVPRPASVRLTAWIEGLEAPWSLVFLPDGRALVSERPGRIRLIEDDRLREAPYVRFDVARRGEGLVDAVVSAVHGGEGGLMGLALHPRFSEAPYVYAMHTYRGEDGVRNRVVRLVDRGDHGRFDRVVLDGIPGGLNHNGGRIAFGPDGMLYVTTGETFDAELAADLGNLGGKILRVAPDGSVPPDNPFPGSPVYSLGHRNPQGLAWHPETGELFASEHGPSGEFGLGALDEINVIRPGGNLGWPAAVGAPGLAGYRDPIVAWTGVSVPPAGMTFWRGGLFVAVLGSGSLARIALERAQGRWRAGRIDRWFAEGPRRGVLGRLRDAVAGPDGALYLLTSNRDGRGRPGPGDDRIYRLAPTDP